MHKQDEGDFHGQPGRIVHARGPGVPRTAKAIGHLGGARSCIIPVQPCMCAGVCLPGEQGCSVSHMNLHRSCTV